MKWKLSDIDTFINLEGYNIYLDSKLKYLTLGYTLGTCLRENDFQLDHKVKKAT